MRIATSLNPFSRMDIQIKCFNKWVDLGCDVQTFNIESEVEFLLDAGIDASLIHILDIDSTGNALFSNKAPRILPILKYLYNNTSSEEFFLINSDIYPRFRKSPSVFKTLFEAAAFTRSDLFSIDQPRCMRSKPYHGGLDVFYLNRNSLGRVLTSLKLEHVSERMTFGVPGWDYFLAGMLINSVNNFQILEGTSFLHESHIATYYGKGIDEFEKYMPFLGSVGLITSSNISNAALEFSQLIFKSCRNNLTLSNRIDYILKDYSLYLKDSNLDPAPIHLEDLARYSVDTKLDKDVILFLIKKCMESGFDINRIESYLCQSKPPEIQFLELLKAFYIVSLAKIISNKFTFSNKYPKNNAHKAAIKSISNYEDASQRKLQYLKIFFSEVLLYGIFNLNLLKAIILMTQNDQERYLIRCIINLLRLKK
jgi:hypothetical protein